MLRRSQLYVPGNNERMVVKAAGLGADSVILDLEDAVPEDEKDSARELVVRLSRELSWARELCVRINPRSSKQFAADLAAVKKCEHVATVVVPKAEGDYSSIHSRTGKAVIPIIETAAGLLNLRTVAGAVGVSALTYGAADYAASVGGSVPAYLDSLTIKTLLVAASADAGVDAIDNVFFDLNDAEGFRRQATAARTLGYVGKQVVHPSQVGPANEVFSSNAEEVAWAEKVLAELKSASSKARGAVRVDGFLVDAVHYRIARGIIERSQRRVARE